MVLLLRPEEIDGLICMREAIEVVRAGFSDWTGARTSARYATARTCPRTCA